MATTEKSFKKGYKFRIYPTEAQQELLAKTFGCCRYLWNTVLAETHKEYQAYLLAKENNTLDTATTPNLSGNTLCLRVPKHRANPNSLWLNEVSSVALQQTMLTLGTAYDNYFRSHKTTRKNKHGQPKFKKKTGHQSFRLMKTAFRLKSNQLYIAKLDTPIDVLWSRDLPSEPSSLTISKTPTNEYYVSFVCEYTPPKTTGTEYIGIDVGLTTYATLSDGTTLDNPKWLKQHLKSLRRAQQTLSRRKRGSRNYHKANQKVARLHQRVTNSRHDWQHKVTRSIVNKSHVIGVEALRVANMIQNRKLSRAIADAAWSSFFNKLKYKVEESQHATLVYVSTYFPSSHLCSVTGQKLDRKLKLSERSWNCPFCGHTHDRDLNAAVNIENKALELYHSLAKDLSGQVCVISG